MVILILGTDQIRECEYVLICFSCLVANSKTAELEQLCDANKMLAEELMDLRFTHEEQVSKKTSIIINK